MTMGAASERRTVDGDRQVQPRVSTTEYLVEGSRSLRSHLDIPRK